MTAPTSSTTSGATTPRPTHGLKPPPTRETLSDMPRLSSLTMSPMWAAAKTMTITSWETSIASMATPGPPSRASVCLARRPPLSYATGMATSSAARTATLLTRSSVTTPIPILGKTFETSKTSLTSLSMTNTLALRAMALLRSSSTMANQTAAPTLLWGLLPQG